MREDWPGTTTLVFPGRPGLHACCYQKGRLALRVDADPLCRDLAASVTGGMLISSSLNRRGQPMRNSDRRLRMRWHRYLGGWCRETAPASSPSTMLLLKGSRILQLR